MSLEDTKRVCEAIKAERIRQVMVEGHASEGDDRLVKGELARAAACYALMGGDQSRFKPDMTAAASRLLGPEPMWPWERAWWNPSLSRRRNLLKAAALIVAELERLDRLEGVR